MALLKLVKQKNGLALKYHRIVDIKNILNDCTLIKIYSYYDEKTRKEEQKQKKYSPYKETIYKEISVEKIPYNDSLTAENAYDYLKTLDKYKGAEDV